MVSWKRAGAVIGAVVLGVGSCCPIHAQDARMNGVAGFPNTTTGILRSAQDDGGELLVAQANLDPTHDDKAVVNGAPGAARSAQDDGGVALVAQANPDPTHDDKAVVNGAPKGSGIVKATPAIWRVKGAHGTVYLFGSIHVMKPNVDWQTAQVKAAMAAAGTLYVEVANLDDPMAALPIAAQLGMDAEHPLSTKVEKSDLPLLDTAAKEMGLPGEAMLEPMQPWLVSTSLSVLPMIKAGYDPKSGIDMVMLAQAKRENKSVVGFETMEEQMHLLADAPEAEQVELLHQELTEMDKDTAEMNELVSAWEKGDVDKIAALENGELKAKHPAEYKRLAVDRNVKWAETLDGLLKDPTAGDVLVVVGAAHLAGPDSLMEQLKKRGWKVERE